MQSSQEDLEVSVDAPPWIHLLTVPYSSPSCAHFHQAQKSSERSLVLEWENIDFSVKNKKILINVSGRVESGEMLASSSF